MKLKNPHFLTPSKASALAAGDFGFLRRYALGDKPEESAVMERGTRIHELFYHLLRNFGKSDRLAYIGNQKFLNIDEQVQAKREKLDKEGVKYKVADLRKECKSVSEQEAEFVKISEVNEMFIVQKDLEEVARSILLHFQINPKLKEIANASGLRFELPLEDVARLTTGILDIAGGGKAYDVKATGREVSADEFIKWNERKLAVQQGTYEDLCQANDIPCKEFNFILIQTAWPYEIRFIKLPTDYVRMTMQWFYASVYPKYREYLKKIEEYKRSIGLDKPGFFLEKDQWTKNWKAIVKLGLYNPSRVEEAKVSRWEKQKLSEEITRIEQEASHSLRSEL